MNIFDFDSYKEFIGARVRSMPRQGRGELQKIALHLKIHGSMVSQILRGDKHPTLEQASLLADYLGLSELETDYLICQVGKERAGNAPLRSFYDRRLKKVRAKWEQPPSRLRKQFALSEADHAEFYSHWYISAIRLLTSITGTQTLDSIADYVQLPKRRTAEVLQFLVSRGLCEEKEGKFTMKVQRTHLPKDSPFAARHHINWRLKALEKIPQPGTDSGLSFTSPFTASSSDEGKLRRLALEFIGEFSRVVDVSAPEKIYCLNLDWFDV